MQRRQFIRYSSLSTAGLLLLPPAKLAAGLWQTDPWKINMLTKQIGIFAEKGGTILFYIAKKEIVVVDAQFPEQSKHLIDYLRKEHQQPFGLLINTHHHGDHSSGNVSFKGMVTHVLAHENSKANQQRVAKEQKKEDQQLFPDQTFATSWSEKHGNERITLHYFGAAHTNGDSLIHFEKANIVHMGDLLFNRRHPFVDRSSGASIASWILVLEKALKQFNSKTRYVFGHAAEGYGVTGNGEDLKAFQDYLTKLLVFTESEIKAGKTKEEFIKTTVLPFQTQWKGDGLQRSLTAAYEEVAGK
jgi:cyclase